jgi:hypothetical protein
VSIAQVVLPAAGLLLADARPAGEVGVRPVGEHLRQPSGEVEGMVG